MSWGRMPLVQRNALVRIASRIGMAYDTNSRYYHLVDALVDHNCQCVIVCTGKSLYEGFLLDSNNGLYYDEDTIQYVLFPDALNILGPF